MVVISIVTDLELDTVDARELAGVLRQMRSVLASTQNNLTDTKAALLKALDTNADKPAPAASPSAY